MEAKSGAVRVEERFLHEIISTVGSSVELWEVLEGVVRLLSEASAAHACFVYLLDRDRKKLVLRAASAPYASLVGEIELLRGEGLAWWAIEHRESAFIRENALDDPRVKYVPELEEERFQSLVAIPILGRRGDPIGAITLDTEAPREFTDSEVVLLVSTASLVAGAIENARLYDEMRLRVGELEHLTELAEAVAAAETVEALGPEVVRRSRDLLGRVGAPLPAGRRRGAAAAPLVGSARPGSTCDDRARRARARARAQPPGAAHHRLADRGRRAARRAHRRAHERARPGARVANQAAVALKKIQVLERLAEKNLIKDFFEDLAARRLGAAVEGRSARLGCDLDAPHVVIAAEPAGDALERALLGVARGSLVDRREQALRALVPVSAAGADRLLDELRAVHADAGGGLRSGSRPSASARPPSPMRSRRRGTPCSGRPFCAVSRP